MPCLAISFYPCKPFYRAVRSGEEQQLSHLLCFPFLPLHLLKRQWIFSSEMDGLGDASWLPLSSWLQEKELDVRRVEASRWAAIGWLCRKRSVVMFSIHVMLYVFKVLWKHESSKNLCDINISGVFYKLGNWNRSELKTPLWVIDRAEIRNQKFLAPQSCAHCQSMHEYFTCCHADLHKNCSPFASFCSKLSTVWCVWERGILDTSHPLTALFEAAYLEDGFFLSLTWESCSDLMKLVYKLI